MGRFRGTNLVGMEMDYARFTVAGGPVANTNYPVHNNKIIDYLVSKRVSVIRFLFSWEGMQSTLYGPIPAATTGNYKAYFDNYKRIVDYATSKGMHVIVGPWQMGKNSDVGGATFRGDLVGSTAVPNEAFADFWTKMANIYKSNPLVSYALADEINNISTMQWWTAAQVGVNAIRATGSTQRIIVPGNGWTGASSWLDNWYDTSATNKRSNAYGYLNANGTGRPLSDPLNQTIVEIHTYLDENEGGGTPAITAVTAARSHLAVAVNEARARGYKLYLGEIGFYAGATTTAEGRPAADAWADFISYFEANSDVLVGYTWWATGAPGWWNDVSANGGGHFSLTPTNGTTYTGDTVNMKMIEANF